MGYWVSPWWLATTALLLATWGRGTAEFTWATLGQDECLLTAGFHCNDTTSGLPNGTCVEIEADYILINNSLTVLQCVACFRPTQCMSDNACRMGAAGPTCERCLQAQEDPLGKGYEMLGSSCASCDEVPWALIMAVTALIVVIGASIKNGFSASVATKVKLLLDLFQWVLLAIHVHVAWPSWMVRTLRPASFAMLSIDMLNLDCYLGTPSYFYKIRWLSNFFLPLLTLLVVGLIDSRLSSSLRRMGTGRHRVLLEGRRLAVRRALLVLLLAWYFPACQSALHTNACSDTLAKLTLSEDQDLFLYSQDQSCETLVYQVMQFFGTFSLLFIWLPLPLVIVFLTLRNKKWKLLGTQLSSQGCLYESYRLKYCFWDAVPLLMKLVALLPTNWLPTPALFQCCLLLGMTLGKLFFVATLRPYRRISWEGRWRCLTWLNIHNLLEVLSCVVAGTLLACCLLRLLLEEIYPVIIDYIALVLIGSFLILWLLTIMLVHRETATEELEALRPDSDDGESEEPEPWQRNSLGTGLDTKEIHARNSALDF